MKTDQTILSCGCLILAIAAIFIVIISDEIKDIKSLLEENIPTKVDTVFVIDTVYVDAGINFQKEVDGLNLLRRAKHSDIEKWLRYAHETSNKYDVSYELIKSIIATESSWRHRAKSKAGAIGLMQVMPATAKIYEVSRAELYDPYKNMYAGIRYLSDLQKRYGSDDTFRVLTAYSHGPTKTDRYSEKYISSNKYVKTIFAKMSRETEEFYSIEYSQFSTMSKATAVIPESGPSSQIKVRELSPKAHLRGFEPSQIQTRNLTKGLHIE